MGEFMAYLANDLHSWIMFLLSISSLNGKVSHPV